MKKTLYSLFCLIIGVVFSTSVMAGLTVTNEVDTVFGDKRIKLCTIAFDSSYAYGGETFDLSNYRMVSANQVIITPQEGYTFEWDGTNEKIKVYKNAPPIVFEEQHTIASNSITLNYPAAAIINMASATATQLLIEPSDTVASNEVQLSAAMSEGARPSFTFHGSTSGVIKTTYITQAWRDVWVNRLNSESVTVTTNVGDTDNTLCFVESMLATGTTGTSRPKFIRGGDAAATLECEVDWTDSGASTAGDTTFTFAAGEVTALVYSGIQLPTSGFLKERFVEDEDLTMSSGTGASAFPVLLPALCGQIPDYTNANERDPHYLMMASADALQTSGEIMIDWQLRKTLAGLQIKANDTTSDAVSLTYIKGEIAEIPGLVPLEVPNASDLSGLTGVQVMVIGQ